MNVSNSRDYKKKDIKSSLATEIKKPISAKTSAKDTEKLLKSAHNLLLF